MGIEGCREITFTWTGKIQNDRRLLVLIVCLDILVGRQASFNGFFLLLHIFIGSIFLVALGRHVLHGLGRGDDVSVAAAVFDGDRDILVIADDLDGFGFGRRHLLALSRRRCSRGWLGVVLIFLVSVGGNYLLNLGLGLLVGVGSTDGLISSTELEDIVNFKDGIVVVSGTLHPALTFPDKVEVVELSAERRKRRMVEVLGENFRLDQSPVMNDEPAGDVLLGVAGDEGHGMLILLHHLKETSVMEKRRGSCVFGKIVIYVRY